MNIALILSGGAGSRFGSCLPKPYHMISGKEVIAYSIDALRLSLRVDDIIVICGHEFIEAVSAKYRIACIEGGATRNASLKNGLNYIRQHFPGCKKVFINEAARPFLTIGLVDMYYDYLNEYDAVITTQYITDSLGREGEAVTDRSEYYLIQAPEAFRFDLLYRHFSAESPITATVQQLPVDIRIKKYFDFKHNIKITYKEDLIIAEQIMKTVVDEQI